MGTIERKPLLNHHLGNAYWRPHWWILGVVSLTWAWLERIYQHRHRNDNQQLQGGYIQRESKSVRIG